MLAETNKYFWLKIVLLKYNENEKKTEFCISFQLARLMDNFNGGAAVLLCLAKNKLVTYRNLAFGHNKQKAQNVENTHFLDNLF